MHTHTHTYTYAHIHTNTHARTTNSTILPPHNANIRSLRKIVSQLVISPIQPILCPDGARIKAPSPPHGSIIKSASNCESNPRGEESDIRRIPISGHPSGSHHGQLSYLHCDAPVDAGQWIRNKVIYTSDMKPVRGILFIQRLQTMNRNKTVLGELFCA